MENPKFRENTEEAGALAERGHESALTPIVDMVMDAESRQLLSPAERQEVSEAPSGKRARRMALLQLITLMAFSASGLAQNRVVEDKGRLTIETTSETGPDKIKANKNKTEKLRKALDDKKLRKEISYLKSVYGDAINFLLLEIKADEADFEKLQGASDLQSAYYYTALAGRYDFYWNKKEILKRAAERKSHFPKISGFEQAGHTNEKVRSMLAEFPHELIENIDEIRYVPEEIQYLPENERHRAEWKAGHADYISGDEAVIRGGRVAPKPNVVYIYKFPGIEKEKELRLVLLHEGMGHENSWESSHRLTTAEQVEMLADATRLLLDPKRPQSDYIDASLLEKFQSDGYSAEETRYNQVNELWAELVERYADGFEKENYGLLQRKIIDGWSPPQDLVLVDKWLNKMDVKEFATIKTMLGSEESQKQKFTGHLRNPRQ